MRPFLKQIAQLFLLLLQIYVGANLIGVIINPNKNNFSATFFLGILFLTGILPSIYRTAKDLIFQIINRNKHKEQT